jgi:LAO/AO transport system kinase
VKEIWEAIVDFERRTRASGVFLKRRKEQALSWFHSMIAQKLKSSFLNHPQIENDLPQIEESIAAGELTPTAAAERLMKLFNKK